MRTCIRANYMLPLCHTHTHNTHTYISDRTHGTRPPSWHLSPPLKLTPRGDRRETLGGKQRILSPRACKSEACLIRMCVSAFVHAQTRGCTGGRVYGFSRPPTRDTLAAACSSVLPRNVCVCLLLQDRRRIVYEIMSLCCLELKYPLS